MDLNDPKTILVVQIGKIGDMILTTPLFSELKNIFPQSRLIVLASEINKDIPLNHSSVDEVIVYKKNIFKIFLLISSLYNKIDLWIDTKDNFSKTSAMLIKLFKPKFSLGFNFDRKVFDISLVKYSKGKHSVDVNLSAVNYLQNKNDDPGLIRMPSFTIPELVTAKFKRESSKFIIPNILLNVSAGDQSRYLEKDIWIDIIMGINSKEISSFTLIGLVKDMQLINSIVTELPAIQVSYLRNENILETAAAVKVSDVVITPDTSIVHICSAFNIPVIAFYPCVEWNLEKFRPLSDYNEVITGKDKYSVKDIKAMDIIEGYFRLTEKINSGNAESRTRVRKEDH